MSWREFIASLVDSLAWPAALVLCVLLFRDQVASLLAGPLKRLSIGSVFEAEWERGIEQAREALPELAESESGRGSGGPSLPPGGFVGDLWGLVEVSPQAAVVEGYRRIEGALLRRLGGVLGDEVRPAPARQLARIAAEHGLVTGETVRAIDGLSNLRNLAAHAGNREVTADEAGEYLALVEAVLGSIVTWVRPDNPDEH